MWQNKVRRLCDPRLALSMCTYTPTNLTRSFETQRFSGNLKQWFSPFVNTTYWSYLCSEFKRVTEKCWVEPQASTQNRGFFWEPVIPNPKGLVHNSKLNWSVGDTEKQQLTGVKTNEGNATVRPLIGLRDAWRGTQNNRLSLRLKMIFFIKLQVTLIN